MILHAFALRVVGIVLQTVAVFHDQESTVKEGIGVLSANNKA